MDPSVIEKLRTLNSNLPFGTAVSLPEQIIAGAPPQPPTLSPELEKRKQNIELIKWLIGSFVLVVMTSIINWNLKDREDSFKEVQEYNKYATDLIILNNDPVKRRMLAQFFAKVIPTDKVRSGWQDYYELVEPEYQTFLVKNDSAQKQYAALAKKTDPTKQEQAKKDSLSNFIQQNQVLIKSDIITPGPLSSTGSMSSPRPVSSKNPSLAAQLEATGFNYFIQKDVTNAIAAFENADAAYPTYHQVYEIGSFLRQRKGELLDRNSPVWPSIYATIVNKFSWQMPPAIKNRLLILAQPISPKKSETPPANLTVVPSAESPPASAPQPAYGPKEFSITLGYSQRIGYRDDKGRLLNIALDKIDEATQSVDIRISLENKKFKKQSTDEPHYTLLMGEAKLFPFYGFPYKLRLVRFSAKMAWLSIERYTK